MHLTALDKKIISMLQDDLPLDPEPFEKMASDAGLSVDELIKKIGEYLDNGLLRRLGAVLYHQNAGFKANAMCGWVVPEERISEVGLIMASFKEASHVYQRPTYTDWPYNIFTMLHGKSSNEIEKIARNISENTKVSSYEILYSIREFKKTSMKYF
jgi:siroheme decarboxylase